MTQAFYDSVLPPFGNRVLAVFKNGLDKPPVHEFFDTNEDLIEAAATYDGLKKNVYHACSVYTEPTNRKGENVQAIKALWADFDVGEKKPYAKQREPVQEFEDFRAAVNLPKSHVVSSGNGIHMYLPFTKAIPPENWDRLAALFAQCMDHFGLKHDPSRTTDKASILRVPGTSNYKTDPAKAVVLKRLGEEAPAAQLWKSLKAYADANNLIVGETKPKGKPKETNDLIGNKDYPPSHGDLVAEHCAVIKEVADTGGDVPYDVWWPAMGVAAHTTEPQAVAIKWTKNRAATGHDKDDWAGAIDQWQNFGPGTCTKFQESQHAAAKCESCKFKGKISSPIQLGVSEQPEINTDAIGSHKQAPKELKKWGFNEEWIVKARHAATRTGVDDDGRMTRSQKQEDGTYKQVPFCNRYWQVLQRVRSIDGTYQLEIGYIKYNGKPHETFLFDSADVMSGDKLRSAFSARELHIYGGQPAIKKAQDLIMQDQDLLASYQLEAEVHHEMGWVTHGKAIDGAITGDFVLGNHVFRPGLKAPEPIIMDAAATDIVNSYDSNGTTAEWVNLVDRIYNRPGAEAYQFLILSAFAAPLVKITRGGGEWHGVPIVLSGDSGAAKTTTALVAASIYGKPKGVMFTQSSDQSDTLNAVTAKLGTIRNLPYIMDEMSNRTEDYISSVLYMLANGRSKDRMMVDGKLQASRYRWDTIGWISSNDSLHETLENIRNQNTQDAGKYRSFEVFLNGSDLKTVFHDVTKSDVEEDLLHNQYGCVGREWIQFLVNNRLKIEDIIAKKRRTYCITETDVSSMRFYKDLILMVKAAGELAKYKGWIHFDVDAVVKWAEDKVLNLVVKINHKDWDGRISDFVASLHGRTIVTRNFREGRGRRHDVENPMEVIPGTTVPVARKALDDKRFFVTASALRDWCRTFKVQPSEMVMQMASRGYLQLTADKAGRIQAACAQINIGSGTTISRPRAPCYEFIYSAVTFEADDDKVVEGNVIPLVAPAAVTGSVTDQGEEAAAAV